MPYGTFTKFVTTRHPLQSLLLHITLYKVRCYTAPITKPHCNTACFTKPIATQHPLQNLLVHDTLQSPKETPGNIYRSSCLHMAIFYKIPKYYFGNILQKNTILLWQHFIKNPKLLIFGQTIILSKSKYYAQSPKLIIFGTTYFDILNSLANMQTHGKHKLFTTYLFYKIYGNYTYFTHKKLQLHYIN